MIVNNIPELLHVLKTMTAADETNLTLIQNLKTLTFGFQVGDRSWEVEMTVWRTHYGVQRHEKASLNNGLARWRADVRKACGRTFPINLEIITVSERQEIPTAWARILKDDD